MNQELKVFMIFTSMVPFPSRSTSIIRLLSSSSVGFWPMALMTPSSSLEEMAPLPSCCIPPVKCNMQNWVHLVKLIKCFFEFSSLYFLWAKSSKYAKLTRRKSYFDSWILCVSWHFDLLKMLCHKCGSWMASSSHAAFQCGTSYCDLKQIQNYNQDTEMSWFFYNGQRKY